MTFEIQDENVSLAGGEEDRIKAALVALSKDHHAPREITVTLTLHIHHEYPKMLYKGTDSVVVKDEAEEDAKNAEGFGDYAGPVAVEEPVVDAPAAQAPVSAGPALVPAAPAVPEAPAKQPDPQAATSDAPAADETKS